MKLLPAAEEDLSEIIINIARENPQAAQKLVVKLEKKLSNLSSFPWMGSVPHDKDVFELGYRFLVIESHIVFYKVEGNNVFIYRILHGARDYLSLLLEEVVGVLKGKIDSVDDYLDEVRGPRLKK